MLLENLQQNKKKAHFCDAFVEKKIHQFSFALTKPLHVEEYEGLKIRNLSLLVIRYLVFKYTYKCK